MKKTVRVVSLIVVIALALLVLTGCSDTPTVSGTKADVQAQMAVANSLTANQPTPTDISYSLERYNLIRRAYWVNGQREKANALMCAVEKPLGYIVLFAGNTVVGNFVVDGKVTSLNSFLSPDSEYYEYLGGDFRAYNKWLADVDGSYAEKLSWAEQAKMRANKTAASYNEYVLKNSFVWNGNVPADIRTSLPYLD